MAVHSNSFTFRWSVLQIWTRSNLLPISFRVLNRFEYRQEINRQTEKQKKSVSVCLLFFWSVCSGENTKIILASRSASLATRLLLTHSVCVHIKLLCVWERESGWTQVRERESIASLISPSDLHNTFCKNIVFESMLFLANSSKEFLSTKDKKLTDFALEPFWRHRRVRVIIVRGIVRAFVILCPRLWLRFVTGDFDVIVSVTVYRIWVLHMMCVLIQQCCERARKREWKGERERKKKFSSLISLSLFTTCLQYIVCNQDFVWQNHQMKICLRKIDQHCVQNVVTSSLRFGCHRPMTSSPCSWSHRINCRFPEWRKNKPISWKNNWYSFIQSKEQFNEKVNSVSNLIFHLHRLKSITYQKICE